MYGLLPIALLLTTVNARSVVEQPVTELDFVSPISIENSSSQLVISNATAVEPLPTKSCSCEERYFKHYKVKDCEPVYEEGCECPVRFNCPDDFMQNSQVCYYDGATYKAGEPIKTKNKCEICTCRESYFGNTTEIDCIYSECPSIFRPRLEKGCYDVFEVNSCCASGTKCDTDNINGTSTEEQLCVLDGQTYHFGQRMYPKSDPCLTCLCSEKYTGIYGETCTTHNCMLEKKRQDLKEGCLPIYHEGTCCPIEFHCYTGEEEVIPAANPSVLSTDAANKCVFQGRSYNLGDILDIKHPTNCVTCTCSTPPDFTCVHSRCPGPPNDDYEHCRSSFVPGSCCATYDCSVPKIQFSPRAACAPVHCGEKCTEVSVPNGCPMCFCKEIACSTPFCPSQCVLDMNVPENSCPYCNCTGGASNQQIDCAPVKCGPQCYEATNQDGCPMCLCTQLCVPPKCELGCDIQTDVDIGECPGCSCVSNSSSVSNIQCGVVKCPPGCLEQPGDHGCPKCHCEPLCSPPKCDAGCRVEAVPSSGPCPGCDCGAVLTGPPQCAPVKCEAPCTEVSLPNGCPFCRCSTILCSPPSCPEGCEIDNNVEPGKCPQCKCPPTIMLDRPICAPVKCSPQCYEAISAQGCPMCLCGPLCSPPKCEDGCHVQYDVPEGQCPGCACPSISNPNKKGDNIQCSPVQCPPMCREAIGDHGCLTCVCDPLCTPPKCDVGCYVESVPSSGPCPSCVCPPNTVVCEPVFCGPTCHTEPGDFGCDTCKCDDICDIPFCDPGCHIDTSGNSGPCPGCVCDSDGIKDLKEKPQCAVVKCESHCRESLNDFGCPMCDCSECPRVECHGDCFLEVAPPPRCPEKCICRENRVVEESLRCPHLYCELPCMRISMAPGMCPVCQCRNEPSLPVLPNQVQCSPPRCDPGCEVQLRPGDVCPGCVCTKDQDTGIPPLPKKVLCSPPRCKAGCVIKLRPGGVCPGCVCPEDEKTRDLPTLPQTIQCSPPKCDPGCNVELKPGNVCPGCVCPNEAGGLPILPQTIQCSPPKCDPGCKVELKPGDVCPGCVCSGEKSQNMMCAPVKCAPMCREAVNQFGCPSCLCGPLCSPPRCDAGCHIDPNPSGPCPGCVCPNR